MYAKIESERLRYLRFNQAKLWSEDYIQETMAYVCLYGRPDVFSTFKFTAKWKQIQNLLLPDQQSIHRHDILARVFKKKLKLNSKIKIFGLISA